MQVSPHALDAKRTWRFLDLRRERPGAVQHERGNHQAQNGCATHAQTLPPCLDHNQQMRSSPSVTVLAAAFHLLFGLSVAFPQTAIVRHASPGSTLELVLDTAVVGSATTAADGMATVTAQGDGQFPLDANVWVDRCANRTRLVLARRGVQPAADPACTRTQIEGLYLVQRITTFVVDVQGTPTMRLRQGPAPGEWLRDPQLPSAAAAAEPLPPLTGLTMFAAAGLSTDLDFRSTVCGNATSCSDKAPWPLTGGVGWWFTDFVGAEARYNYLGEIEADGSGQTFSFNSAREGGVLSVTGRAGYRSGRFRPFARGGMGYHRATLTTTETVNETTVVVDGISQTIPGGTQIIQVETSGWAPVFGGGAEVWLSPIVGIWGEVQRLGLKGEDRRGGEARIDDAAITAQFGLTFRLP